MATGIPTQDAAITVPNNLIIPTTLETVAQNLLIEPLGGPQVLDYYLQNFPDEIYDKGQYSLLVYLLYTLLGPAGVGNSRAQYLQLRLLFEDAGFSLYALDKFFGDPFQFGRAADEVIQLNTTGLFPSVLQTLTQSLDASYRNRILDFFNGARLGNTPQGMLLAATSGLGYDCDLIENYKYLYNIHSDKPLDVTYYGQTDTTDEMVVLPRQAISRSATQIVTITGHPTGGSFQLVYNGANSPGIAFDASAADLQLALEAIPTIGTGNVHVISGNGPETPWNVRFTGHLANMSVPQFTAINFLIGGLNADIAITTTVSGISSAEELINVTPQQSYEMRQAIDRIKPLTTIPTLHPATGVFSEILQKGIFSSSDWINVILYVSGTNRIVWPPLSGMYWIEAGVEHEARRVPNTIPYHYEDFHEASVVYGYGDDALSDVSYLTDVSSVLNHTSQHVGAFVGPQANLFPVLKDYTNPDTTFSPSQAIPTPLQQTRYTDIISGPDGQRRVINEVYSVDYLSLPGAPTQTATKTFWASVERASGADYIEIDFGQPQAVNFLEFEMLPKPFDIEIAYDLLDQAPQRNFIPVTPDPDFPYPHQIYFTSNPAPWEQLQFHVVNSLRGVIYTRYIRIKFNRRIDATVPFLYDNLRRIQNPWSVEVRNLRIGRAASETTSGA